MGDQQKVEWKKKEDKLYINESQSETKLVYIVLLLLLLLHSCVKDYRIKS